MHTNNMVYMSIISQSSLFGLLAHICCAMDEAEERKKCTYLWRKTISTLTSSLSLCRKSLRKLETLSRVIWPQTTMCLEGGGREKLSWVGNINHSGKLQKEKNQRKARSRKTTIYMSERFLWKTTTGYGFLLSSLFHEKEDFCLHCNENGFKSARHVQSNTEIWTSEET